MDLKIDFSDLLDSIKKIFQENNNPLVDVEVRMNDDSEKFSDMKMYANMLPLPGDLFKTESTYYELGKKVKVLYRELYYYDLGISSVILTVEKV